MAGHSKWANIQHRKGRQDAARSKLFSKLSKEITVAAKMGDPDPEKNPRLRLAVKEAKSSSVPKDVIERAIKKSTAGDGEEYEEIRYEGYGPNGIAVIVEAMTDNRNRTVAEVRHAFSKHGGNLGTDGSVAYLFNRLGVINYAPGQDEEQVMELALDAGAEDVESDEEGGITVTTSWESLGQVSEKLASAGLPPDHSEVTMLASNTSECDVEQAQKVLKLIDVLEDLDDVQEVYSNGQFPDAAYE